VGLLVPQGLKLCHTTSTGNLSLIMMLRVRLGVSISGLLVTCDELEGSESGLARRHTFKTDAANKTCTLGECFEGRPHYKVHARNLPSPSQSHILKVHDSLSVSRA
jgi:hypothetical protein